MIRSWNQPATSNKKYQISLFYIPGSGRPVVVNVVVVPQDDGFKVKRIIFDNEDVFYAYDGVTLVANQESGLWEYLWQKNSVDRFESNLASEMAAPLNQLVISYSERHLETV